MSPKQRHMVADQFDYQTIFQFSPTPYLIQDFSVLEKIKKELEGVRYRNLASYLQRNKDLLLKYHQKVRVLQANQAALDLFGARSLKELQRNLRDSPPREYLRMLATVMAELMEGHYVVETELRIRSLQRKARDVQVRLNIPPSQREKWKGVLISLQDITKQKEYERNLQKVAQTDGLTELWNHSAILARLEEEFKRAFRYNKDLSCLLIDLDHFKGINDLCGHQRGDAVLRKTAQMIRSFVREVDIVGRYGGDEFLVILPETPVDKAKIVAERLVNVFDGLTHSKKEEIFSTISVGLAGVPHASVRTPKMLLGHVDRAMYRAKKAGRNASAVVPT